MDAAAAASAAEELERFIDARVMEKGHAVFAQMQDRIAQLRAENDQLKAMLGIPAGTPVMVPDPDYPDSDDPLDFQ